MTEKVTGVLFTFTCGGGVLCDVFVPSALGSVRRKRQEGPVEGPPGGSLTFYTEPDGEEDDA